MKIRELNLILYIILLGLSLGNTSNAQKSENLPILRQFEQNKLGLMDISSDGKLLLLHQNIEKKREKVSVRMHRLHIVEAVSQKEIATLEFESDYPYMIFLPDSHEIFFTERLITTNEKKRYQVWNPDTGKIRNLEKLDAVDFQFVQVFDKTYLLGTIPNIGKRSSFVLYDFFNEKVEPINLPQIENMWSNNRIIFSPDHKSAVGLENNTLVFRSFTNGEKVFSLETDKGIINSYEYSPDGKYLVIISKDKKSEREIEVYLSVYETFNFRRLSFQRILTNEKIEKRGLLHIGDQLAISPDNRWLVVGYDRLSSFFITYYSQAKYAVFELPSGRYIGTVNHPPVKKSDNWAFVSPAQSGRLRFSNDSNSFYTTSSFARQWKLPE